MSQTQHSYLTEEELVRLVRANPKSTTMEIELAERLADALDTITELSDELEEVEDDLDEVHEVLAQNGIEVEIEYAAIN